MTHSSACLASSYSYLCQQTKRDKSLHSQWTHSLSPLVPSQAQSSMETLQEAPNILVIGAAGAGKSALIRLLLGKYSIGESKDFFLHSGLMGHNNRSGEHYRILS